MLLLLLLLMMIMMMMVSRTTLTPALPPDQIRRDLLMLLLTGFFCRLGLGLGRHRRRCCGPHSFIGLHSLNGCSRTDGGFSPKTRNSTLPVRPELTLIFTLPLSRPPLCHRKN